MLCDHLEGWDKEGGREAPEGGDIGIHIAASLCSTVETNTNCKAIILQLKKVYISKTKQNKQKRMCMK